MKKHLITLTSLISLCACGGGGSGGSSANNTAPNIVAPEQWHPTTECTGPACEFSRVLATEDFTVTYADGRIAGRTDGNYVEPAFSNDSDSISVTSNNWGGVVFSKNAEDRTLSHEIDLTLMGNVAELDDSGRKLEFIDWGYWQWGDRVPYATSFIAVRNDADLITNVEQTKTFKGVAAARVIDDSAPHSRDMEVTGTAEFALHADGGADLKLDFAADPSKFYTGKSFDFYDISPNGTSTSGRDVIDLETAVTSTGEAAGAYHIQTGAKPSNGNWNYEHYIGGFGAIEQK
jgi:hypothetical protein